MDEEIATLKQTKGNLEITGVKEGTTSFDITALNASGVITINVEIIKPEIETVIDEQNLGELEDNKDATILATIKSKNPKLSGTLTLVEKTETSVKVESTDFNGQATFTFTIKVEPVVPELNTVLTNSTLGELADNSNTTIATKIVELNEGITQADIIRDRNITIGDITETTAVATGHNKWQGTVNLTFTVKPEETEQENLDSQVKTVKKTNNKK